MILTHFLYSDSLENSLSSASSLIHLSRNNSQVNLKAVNTPPCWRLKPVLWLKNISTCGSYTWMQEGAFFLPPKSHSSGARLLCSLTTDRYCTKTYTFIYNVSLWIQIIMAHRTVMLPQQCISSKFVFWVINHSWSIQPLPWNRAKPCDPPPSHPSPIHPHPQFCACLFSVVKS